MAAIPPSMLTWLNAEKAMNVLPPARMPIAVAATDKVGTVFQLLIQHNILSAPVYDQKAKEHTCVVDLMDIVTASMLLDEQKELGAAIAETLVDALKATDKEVPDLATLVSQKTLFNNVEVRDIANLSERNPFVCLPDTASLMEVIHALQHQHVHRVGLKDSNDNLVNYISESRVLSYIFEQQRANLSRKRLEELNIHNVLPHAKLLVSVRETASAIDAFRLMSKEHVSAVPVVNDHNKVLANVSTKDLKIIGHDASGWQLLHMPVLEYLKAGKEMESKGKLEKLKLKFFSSTHVICCHKEDLFEEVVRRLVEGKVHRVYYTDKHGVLYGVISIKDILSTIAGRELA